MRAAVSAADTKRMIDKLLDKGYQQQAGSVLRSISATVNGGTMKARFAQLQIEMQRLNDVGGKLTADNPVLRAFLADYAVAVEKSAKAIDGAAPGLQQSAIDAADKIVPKVTLPGFSDAQIGAIWNKPDPEAVAKLIGFTDSAAWNKRLIQYSSDTVQQIQDAAIRGIVGGKSPLAIGREVAGLAQDIPLYQAQSMMRTLQLTSYRTANQAYGLANADILSGQVRIAVLDPRTCLSCISLHGTEMGLDERVDDHDQGRCLVPGQMIETMRGSLPIESVLVGDMVLTHKGNWKRVINVFARQYDGDVISVSANGQNVMVTPEHQVLTDHGWVEANALSNSDTLFSRKDIFSRLSKRRIVQPNSRNLSSLLSSSGRRIFVLCQGESSSTSSIASIKAKSRLYPSTASCGIGKSPKPFSADKKVRSSSLERSYQFTWRLIAAFSLASALCMLRINRALKSGSAAACRCTAVVASIGVIFARCMSFINERVFISSSDVIWRYVARSSIYRLVNQLLIGSPILVSNALIHSSLLDLPARNRCSAPEAVSPNTFTRACTALTVRPSSDAMLEGVSSKWWSRIKRSCSSVQRFPAISLPSFINTIVHRSIKTAMHKSIYRGRVYDLEVEDDHSFIANGIVVHNCTSVFVVKGRDVNVQSGADWFENQSDDTQAGMMGPAAYAAYKAGDVALNDFVHPYHDAVYGQMIRESSLTGILGADAQKYTQSARRA